MGVEGLLKYILKTPSTREKIKLREFAKAHLQRTGKQPEILCDFAAVVKWLLSSYDYALIEAEAASPYCLLYGGLLDQYSTRVLSFVRTMESLGLNVVFFVEGAPVSAANMSAVYEVCCAEYHRKGLEASKVLQICASHLDMTRLQWSFREGVVSHVLFSLEVAGNSKMVYCSGQALSETISYMQSNKNVCGILSSNTSYAIAAGCGLFLLDLFDLNVRHPNPLLSYQDVSCEVVWSTWLASALDLSLRQLADLAILCGNEYTHFTNSKSKLSLALGVPLGVPEVAEWLHSRECRLEEISEMKEFLCSNPRYRKVIDISHGAYKWQEKLTSLIQTMPILSEVVLGGGFLSPQMSSLASNGVYWRPTLVEPEILNCPRFCDVTILIRMCIYALMGMSTVTEFGYITAGTNMTQIPVDVVCKADLSTLLPLSKNSRLSILYRLVTFPGVLDKPDNIGNIISGAVEELQAGDPDIPSSSVLLCSLMIFMRASNSRLKPSPNIFVCELDAMLATVLCSLADFPTLNITHIPPAKGVTLASWFSHLVDQVYWLASCLGLSRDLPPPGKLFSSHQYIPFHLASVLCEDFDQSSLPHVWSKLQQMCEFYQELWELAPVLELRAEILTESVPPLSKVVKVFNSSLEALTASEKLRELAKQLEQVAVGISSPPPCANQADKDSFLLDLDDSPMSSVDSAHTLELSFTQECNATEEDHFFSSQSLGPCDLMMESCDEEEELVETGGIDSDCSSEQETEGRNPVPPEDRKSESIAGSLLDFSVAVGVSKNETSTPLCLSPTHTAEVPQEPKVPSQVCNENKPSLEPAALPPPSKASKPKIGVPCKKKCRSLLPTPQRKTLPIMEHRQQILKLIQEHTVVCIEGETGCGKSTKVPQFILDEALGQSPPGNCRILVTQPRRVAAVKLAERVSAERGERLGTTVGYCVGGDHHKAAKTKLTYCTVGYLLQVLVHHPMAIQWYSHIILDEIHERSIDTDFAMLVVRRLVSESGGAAKVIIMSATMQGGLLVNYFTEQFHFSLISSPYFVGAKHYPVQSYFIDELSVLADRSKDHWHKKQKNSCDSLRSMAASQPRENMKAALQSVPRVTDYAMNVCTQVIVSQCKLGESILVFLPGITTISSYFKELGEYLERQDLGKHFRIFVLHSQVPLEDQKDAFLDPPLDVVHVILATNIAESSITLPKLRMVVNFGIYHQLQYDHRKRISCLKKNWCSHASCTQRAGRAGRVFDGVAVHLFTSKFHQMILPQFDQPEILSAPLAKLVLQAKVIGQKLGIPSPSEFLCSAIEQPSLEQMRVALKDLADLGAIASRRDKEVNELAEITLLGHFSLSLPVDLSLCRLVLFSVFFGLPFEGIVIASSLSLYQDVFTLPSRAVTKKDANFLQCLKASTEARANFDRGQYSDSVMVCSMFRQWLEFRNTHLCDTGASSKSKYSLVQAFCRSNCVRWERLMQLESSVAQIAGKVSVFLPRNHKMHAELLQLASLAQYSQGTFHLPTPGVKTGRQFTNVEVHFCHDVLLIKALVTASFSNQIIVGCSEVNHPNTKIRKRACDTLEMMKVSCVDPKESLVMYNLPSPSIPSLHALTSFIIPHRQFSAMVIGKTGYVSLMPKFGTNPKTALMVQQAMARGENLISTDTENSMWNPFMTEVSVARDKLSPELVYFWQFGEHQTEWTLSGMKETFTRPRHPLLACYRRLTADGETAQTVNWRQPSRFLLADEVEGEGTCIAVSATMKGCAGLYQVSVRDLTVLPNMGDCCTALLLVLAFQPLHASVSLFVDNIKGHVVGMKVENQMVLFRPSQYLTRDDLVRVNALRKSISEVLGVFGEDEALFPMEKIASIYSLLDCVLSRSPGNLTTAPSKVNHKKVLEWNLIEFGTSGGDDEGDDEDANFYEEFEFPASDSFCFYPPMNCSFMSDIEVLDIPQHQLRVGHFFDTSEDQRHSIVFSLTRGRRLKQQPEFKLSPLAKSFMPSSAVVSTMALVDPQTVVSTVALVDHQTVVSTVAPVDPQTVVSTVAPVDPQTTMAPVDPQTTMAPVDPQTTMAPVGPQTVSVLPKSSTDSSEAIPSAASVASRSRATPPRDQGKAVSLVQPSTGADPTTQRCSFDVSHMESFFPDFPNFGPVMCGNFSPSVLSVGSSKAGSGQDQLLPFLLDSRLSQLTREGMKQLYLFLSSFNQLMLCKRRLSQTLSSSVAGRRALLSSHPEASRMGLETLEVTVETDQHTSDVAKEKGIEMLDEAEEIQGRSLDVPGEDEEHVEVDNAEQAEPIIHPPPVKVAMDPLAKVFKPLLDMGKIGLGATDLDKYRVDDRPPIPPASVLPREQSPTEQFLEGGCLPRPLPQVHPHPVLCPPFLPDRQQMHSAPRTDLASHSMLPPPFPQFQPYPPRPNWPCPRQSQTQNPPRGQPRPAKAREPVQRYVLPSYAPPPAISKLMLEASESMSKEACSDQKGGKGKRRDRQSSKEKQIREVSALCMSQFRTRYQHPPWVSRMLCPPCKVDPIHVYRPPHAFPPLPQPHPPTAQHPAQQPPPPPTALHPPPPTAPCPPPPTAPQPHPTLPTYPPSSPRPAPPTAPPPQQQQDTWDRVLGQSQPLVKEIYIPPAGSIWNHHSVTPSTHRPSKSAPPIYKQYGLPDDLVAMFLYNYLKVTGGKCHLGTLCGPVYKYFLHSCCIIFSQREMLPMHFFAAYSKKFDVSLEQDVLMVSIKEGKGEWPGGRGEAAGIESPVKTESEAKEPVCNIAGVEAVGVSGDSVVSGSIATVCEETGAGETVPFGNSESEKGEDPWPLVTAEVGGSTNIPPHPTVDHDWTVLHRDEAGDGEGAVLTPCRDSNVLTQDIPTKSSSFNLHCHSWPDLNDQAPATPGVPDHTHLKQEVLRAVSKTYSIFTESSTAPDQEESLQSPESWPHVDSDSSFSPIGAKGVAEGVTPSKPAVDLNAAQSDINLDNTLLWTGLRTSSPQQDATELNETLTDTNPVQSEGQACPPTSEKSTLEEAAPPQRPSSAPGSLRALEGTSEEKDVGGKDGEKSHRSLTKSSSMCSIDRTPDLPLYSPPQMRSDYSAPSQVKADFEMSEYTGHFIRFCQDKLAGGNDMDCIKLLMSYKRKYRLPHFISTDFFLKNPKHFSIRYHNNIRLVSLAKSTPADTSFKSHPFTARPSTSRPPKSLSDNVIAKDMTRLPHGATSCHEDVVAREVVRVLESSSRTGFLSQVLQDTKLTEVLAQNESVTLNEDFFERRAEFEICQDQFDGGDNSDDLYVVLTKKAESQDRKDIRKKSHSTTSASSGRQQYEGATIRDQGRHGDKRAWTPKKDGREGEAKPKKNKKKKKSHKPKEDDGKEHHRSEGGAGEGKDKNWRRAGSRKGRSGGWGSTEDRAWRGGRKEGGRQWRDSDDRGGARGRDQPREGERRGGGWKWRGEPIKPVYGRGVPFYMQRPQSDTEN